MYYIVIYKNILSTKINVLKIYYEMIIYSI